MDLCGHATLATAHVIKKHLQYQGEILNFKTLSGIVKVSISSDKYFLDFPSRIPVATSLPNNLKEALNLIPNRVLKSRDYVLVYENEAAVRNIQIKRNLFDTLNLGTGGVVVTSRGKKVDFVSRFFTPRATLLEDPVTGSSHCSLIPYWASKLNKERLSAQQLSERGGTLICKNQGDRVLIGGEARTFLKGSFNVK
jgi:predicted PhzF superfamily epimerase YddE/YHI9